MSSTLDSLLEQVLDKEFGYAYSGNNLREIVRKNNENMDVSVLDPQNYPLDHKFSFDNELCLKMILLTVAMEHVDSIFDIHGAVRRILKQSHLNYNVIREVWYKRFIRHDLVDQFTRRKEVAPVQLRGLKHTFDTVFIGDEDSDEHSIRVMSAHLIKCNDIKNYENEFAAMFSSEKMLECLENKKFGELMLNEYCNNEDFKLNANILAIISDKVLCCTYMKDIIDEWYCFDVKCMQRGSFDYVNDMFSNHFYGVLSTCKVSEDAHESIFEIQFVEAVISYFCNYES